MRAHDITLALALAAALAACPALSMAASPSPGEILASFPRLAKAVQAVRSGKPDITPRIRKVELTGPGRLDSPKTHYVLTRDVTAPGTAFVIAASDVTLNLNGHKVVYGTNPTGPSHGVLVEGYHRRDIQVTNGTLVQAPGMQDRKEASGSMAVLAPHFVGEMDVSFLEIEYNGPNCGGIALAWGAGAIHHNVVTDLGQVVTNRHQQCSAINVSRSANTTVTANAIVRTRQSGISMGENNTDCSSNAVFVDSVCTNSFGVFYYGQKKGMDKPWACRGNAIKGVGVHPIGIGVVSGAAGGVVEGNETDMLCTRTSAEYGGKTIGSAGFRTTWGADRVEVRGNTFVVRGAKGAVGGQDAWGRAVMIALRKKDSMRFEKNTIKALADAPSVKMSGIAVTGGNESPDLVFEGNDVESTWATVLLGDSYGGADHFPRFVGNTFRKSGKDPGFKWVRDDYEDYPSTGFFAANTLQGVPQDEYEFAWSSSQAKEILFGKPFQFETRGPGGKAVAGREVTVTGAGGEELAHGTSGKDGRVTLYVPVRAVGNMDKAGIVVRSRLTRELGPFKAASGGEATGFGPDHGGPVAVSAGGPRS